MYSVYPRVIHTAHWAQLNDNLFLVTSFLYLLWLGAKPRALRSSITYQYIRKPMNGNQTANHKVFICGHKCIKSEKTGSGFEKSLGIVNLIIPPPELPVWMDDIYMS